MNREELERASDLLGDVLWQMENILNFHGEEDYQDGFFSLRSTLAEAHNLMQDLRAPVMLTEPLEVLVVEPLKSLVIQIRTGTEGRTVSTV